MTLERLSRLRQGVYRLAGAGLSYPTLDLLSAAREARAAFEELGVFDYAFAPEVLAAVGELAEADLDELSIAYVALFEVGVAGAACSPYESAHRSNAQTGEVAGLQSDLKRMIMRFGLRLEESSHDMVDHVATEMNVMAMLCRQEAELHALSAPYKRVASNQLEFLTEHLLPWVPEFAKLVRARQGHPSYTALADGVRSFLAHERQLLPFLVAETPDQP